ncbi:MAG: nucleotidyltransferase family protein [Bacteroidales bacterium]|nr:nucleotidyltransferase family protein [Bacteroidales bacterium]
MKIDNSHHHHTVFQEDGFLVENHYDIVNVHVYKANAELEKSFKAMAMDDSHFIDLSEYDCSQPKVPEAGKSRVYLPSANLHALFQLKHCISHFASTEITLRHVLDWAFFVEKHSSEIDWKWLVETLRRFKMLEFFNYLNSVCVEDLGFDAGMFATANEALNLDTVILDHGSSACSGSLMIIVDKELKERILRDMITPEFTGDGPKGNVFKRVAFKYRRWQANAWKQRLCYSDNRFVAFWKSVWAHILKPSSI